jgi:hypothetical protein
MPDFHIIHKVKRTPILRDGKEYDLFTCTECNEVVKEVEVPDKLPHLCPKRMSSNGQYRLHEESRRHFIPGCTGTGSDAKPLIRKEMD